MARVAVIGGGLAGSSVAFFRARAGDEVVLFEAGGALGGQLVTERDAGFIVEQGAEGFVAGSHAMASLASELGIEERVIGQLVTTSYGFDGRALVPLGPGEAGQFLGFQVPRRDLGAGIRTFAGGMAEVIEALARALAGAASVELAAKVESITRKGDAWELATPRHRLRFEQIVVATHARSAALLLEAEFGSVARELGQATTNSSVTVSLAYRREAIADPLAATGFVVAEAAQVEGFRACTFSSSKLAGRAPSTHALVRAFFRPSENELSSLSDTEWSERAERGVARALSPRTPAERRWVARWPDALPVFDAAHEARVSALESALAGSGVSLSGAAFHGSGIDAALRSAQRAAAHVV